MTRAFSFIVAVSLIILTYIFFTPIVSEGDLGLFLPSPNQWHIPRPGGWLINSVLLLVALAVMVAANKNFNFIPESAPVMTMCMALLLACNCVTNAELSTSTLLLLCNAVCIYTLITTYEARNATREFFVIGTLPAIGSLFQYAFILMIPAYLVGGVLMKSFRLRELVAFMFGLISPYWIAFGLGLLSPLSFNFPGSMTFIHTSNVDNDIFLSLVAMGAMAFIGVILSLYNGVKLFSRNSRLRSTHMAINLIGYVSVLAVILDFNNFMAYYGTLALWLAVQTATLLHLYNIRQPRWALLILLVLFLPVFIFQL